MLKIIWVDRLKNAVLNRIKEKRTLNLFAIKYDTNRINVFNNSFMTVTS